MSTLALFSEFSDRGITIRSAGPDVVVSPEKALTPDLVKRIKEEKPALIRQLEKIRQEAGEDWEEIANDPEQLKAFCELLMIGEMRSQGIAPDHYTAKTECTHCGPVPIFEGVSEKVNGCPWCFNRHKGLPIPKEGK